MTRKEAYIRASKFYLYEPFPEDFDKLDEQEVMDFIENNKWFPFENWEPHGIWELIEDLAVSVATSAEKGIFFDF